MMIKCIRFSPGWIYWQLYYRYKKEFSLRNIDYNRQVDVDVVYKGCSIKGQRIDILVNHEVVVELKAVSQLPDVAMAQVLSYLKATGLKRALLINFGQSRLIDGVRRISL